MFSQKPQLKFVERLIEVPTPQRIHLRGFAGFSDALFAAALCKNAKSTQIFILNSKEEAAYFQNNIDSLLGEKQYFLSASYKKPFQLDEIDNASVLLRAEVLNRINKSPNRQLIVTYPEAIAEKVVTRKNLELNSIEVPVHEKISIDFITEFLVFHQFRMLISFLRQVNSV